MRSELLLIRRRNKGKRTSLIVCREIVYDIGHFYLILLLSLSLFLSFLINSIKFMRQINFVKAGKENKSGSPKTIGAALFYSFRASGSCVCLY